MEPLRNSWTKSLASCSNFPSGKDGFPKRKLFLLFYTAHMIIEKRVGSRFSANMYPSRSMKLVHCFKLVSHNSSSFGHRYKAWWTYSLWDWHKSQLSSNITLHLTRFIFVGREFRHACQTRFLTLLGTFSFQIACQSGLKSIGVRWSRLLL